MFRSKKSAWIRRRLQGRFPGWRVSPPRAQLTGLRDLKVLVVGIYLADRANRVAHLVRRFGESNRLSVTQRWAGLQGESEDPQVKAVTLFASEELIPKFTLLNRLLRPEDLTEFDLVLVSDDDVSLPEGFLETYVAAQIRYGFALAQPARAWHSFYDHRFTLRKPWLRARQTHFVEIGPIFSLTRAAFPVLLPFDSASPMGFGFDFVWPQRIQQAGLTMGIIDAVSVDHSFRPQGSSYSQTKNITAMREYLAANPHFTAAQAKQTVRVFLT